jgi:hypothetical protein
MEINEAGTLAELQALYPRYEEALVTNDVETLMAMFWAAPEVMRFGVTENLYGIEELEAFRKGRPAANLARKVVRLDVVTFGKDFGSVTLEFERETNGKVTRGRQSQTWVRMPEGWRIVAAHVSLLPG